MYQLTIQTGTQTWPFLFKDKDKAEAACKAAQLAPNCKVEDEFGRSGDFFNVTSVVFEDLDQSAYANIAMAMHQQHTQLKFQDIARKDPVLAQAARGGGPGVLTPFGMNGAGMRQ